MRSWRAPPALRRCVDSRRPHAIEGELLRLRATRAWPGRYGGLALARQVEKISERGLAHVFTRMVLEAIDRGLRDEFAFVVKFVKQKLGVRPVDIELCHVDGTRVVHTLGERACRRVIANADVKYATRSIQANRRATNHRFAVERRAPQPRLRLA